MLAAEVLVLAAEPVVNVRSGFCAVSRKCAGRLELVGLLVADGRPGHNIILSSFCVRAPTGGVADDARMCCGDA